MTIPNTVRRPRRRAGAAADVASWTVRSQLVAAVTCVLLLLLGAFGWAAHEAFEDVGARAEAEADFQADLAADAVTTTLDAGLQTIARAAAGVRVPALLADPARCTLSAGTSSLFPDAHIGLVLADGSMPCSSLSQPLPPDSTPYAGQPWLDATGEPGVTEQFSDPVTGSAAVAVTAPTAPTDGEPQAFLVYVLPLEGLSAGLQDIFGGPRQLDVLVVDASGAVLSRTASAPTTLDPEGWVLGATSVPATGWTVATAQPTRVALGPARSTFALLGGLVGAAFLLLLALLVGLNRRLAGPLRRLGDAAAQASRHVVPTIVPEEGPAELRRLTRRFNAMVAASAEYEDRLAHGALHDALTGLPNRALLLDRISAAVQSHRGAAAAPAVLSVDIDRFKLVNASLGYRGGDEVLVAAATRLRELLEPGATLARCGGDGFVLCLPTAGPDDAVALAEHILAVCAQPFSCGDTELALSASVGIALAWPGAAADELVRDADTAMYAAKQEGGGRHRAIDGELRARNSERLGLEADLRAALQGDELRLAYQPVVNLVTREITGVEALLRWEHPTRGTVPPLDFIPLAEETGLIEPLGRLVLELACAQAQEWAAQGHRLRVAVNVSGLQLLDPRFVDHVATLLREHGLEAGQLCLELTETTLMDAIRVPKVLRDLKALGVQLSVDDFGTGYSSLAYLSRFPVDELKIDRSFVQQLSDGDDHALVAAMVAMGHALGLSVIAEGIETDEQVAALLTVGCRSAQGYLFSRPTSTGAVTALLRSGLPQSTPRPTGLRGHRTDKLTGTRRTS